MSNAKTEHWRLLMQEVNTRIRDLQQDPAYGNGSLVIVCECGSPVCREMVEIEREAYESARADETLWIVAPGHENGTPVLERHERFSLVSR